MRRRKMAIVIDELLVVRLFGGHGQVQFVLICSAGHGQTPGVHATTTARERYSGAFGNPKRSEKTASRSVRISPDLPDKPLIHQYFRTIAEPHTEVNLQFLRQKDPALQEKERRGGVVMC